MLEGFSRRRLRALQLLYIHEKTSLTCPNLRGSDVLPSPPEGRPIGKTRRIFSGALFGKTQKKSHGFRSRRHLGLP